MCQKLKSLIKTAVEEIIRENNFAQTKMKVELDTPRERMFGDFSINVAMKLASEMKKSPVEIAKIFCVLLDKKFKAMHLDNKIERIDVKPPGFINIFLTYEALYDVLRDIREQGAKYGMNDKGKGKSVLVEFVSANPTGPLSIAHARQAAVGDTLANILNFCGYNVEKEYYINDEGNQIRNLGLSLKARYLEKLGKLGDFPEDGYKGKYLLGLAEKLEKSVGGKYAGNDSDDALEFFSDYAASEILKQIKEELEIFGVHFDNWYSQKNHITKNKIKAALEELEKAGLIYEEGGATWFKSTAFGDDKDRVIIKSDGALTYLTPDIAYHKMKFNRGFNRLINIWGPDHHGYINRLKAAVCALGHRKEDIDILVIQLATLSRGAKPVVMSTRAGEYITLGELLSEVGKDAARFFFLMRGCDSQLEFDLELAKKHSMDNPVYYVQYAHARISGIRKLFNDFTKKGNFKNIEDMIDSADLSCLRDDESLDLIRKLNCFDDVIISCAVCLDPQALATYLRDLAGQLHAFYNKHRVYNDGEENRELSKARFFLINCVGQVLYTGLKIIGVSAPKEM